MSKRKRSKKPYKRKAKAKTRVDKRQDKAIKKLITQAMPENKFCDFLGHTAIYSNYAVAGYSREFTSIIPVWDPNNTAQPTDETNWERMQNREGRKIFLKGISLKGIFQLVPVGPTTPIQYTPCCRVRVIILHLPMTQNTGSTASQPNIRRILEDSSTIDSHYKKPKEMVYNVLMDKKFTLVNLYRNSELVESTTTVTTVTPPYTTHTETPAPSYQHSDARYSFRKSFDHYIKINKTITYEGNADDGGTGLALKNQYWVFAYSDVDLNPYPEQQPAVPQWTYQGRMHFTDAGA